MARYNVAPDIVRFWRYVERTESCWIWTGSKTNFGHGRFSLYGGNSSISAHRASYMLLRGPVPDDLYVCHNCPGGDNPTCVNPDHLWIGSAAENNLDARIKGTMNGVGEANSQAKLSEEEVRRALRLFHIDNKSVKEISLTCGIPRTYLNSIFRGARWKHVVWED